MRPPRRRHVPILARYATCSATIPIAAFGGHVGLQKLASGFVVPCGTVTHRALGKRTSAVANGSGQLKGMDAEGIEVECGTHRGPLLEALVVDVVGAASPSPG